MATSPACFDIYMENFLKTVQERLPAYFNFFYLAYADDLVFFIDLQHLATTLRIFKDTALEYSLNLNRSKSGIFLCKSNEEPVIPDIDIPFVQNYPYLGVLIDNYGSIKLHLGKIKQRSLYLR